MWGAPGQNMQVKDINYQDEYLLVDVDDSVRDVTKKVLERFPKQVVVIVSEGKAVKGVVYLHMLAKTGIVQGKPDAKVSDAMSKNILEVSPDDDVAEVKKKIEEEKPLGIVVVKDGIKGFVSPVDWAEMMRNIKL